jgi:hypothetical protein
MKVSVVLLVVLSTTVAVCVALPYAEREEESVFSEVSDRFVSSQKSLWHVKTSEGGER